MSYGRHRKPPEPREPRWHDRPRAWLAAALRWLSGTLDDDAPQPYWEGTDDNGEPIGGDLPPVRYGDPAPERVVPAVPTSNGDWAGLKGTISRFNPAWAPCWSRQDVPRPVVSAERSSGVVGPGSLQNVPRPGGNGNPSGRVHTGPGHLSMWDLVPVRSPWSPRPDDTVIISAPRIRPELRLALLAGAT